MAKKGMKMPEGHNVGTKNPMYGKFHINKNKFRKYSDCKFIDYESFIIDASGIKKYLMKCSLCHKEKGYRRIESVLMPCFACAMNKNKKYSTIQKRIRSAAKARLNSRLRRKRLGKSVGIHFKDFPFTLHELMKHLESKFQPGMTWDNYGQWHIDHIRPESSFNYTSCKDQDFLLCWNLDNLQPLWAKDNLKKGARMKALRIECEGGDGAGKTTGLKYLIEQLQLKNKKVIETREVGSPLIPVCVQMRETVLSPSSGLTGAEMEIVFAAMRVLNQAYYRKIEKEYDFIVSDRGWLSHLAYTDHNESVEFTEQLYTNLLGKITALPDVVLYFNVDSDIALKRRNKRGTTDVIEMKGSEFQDKVRSSFIKYIEQLPRTTRVFMINANEDIGGVRNQIDEIVKVL